MSAGSFENVGSFTRDCNGTILRYDEACLEILSPENISFWSQYEECEGCMLLETASFKASGAVVLNTLSPVRYAVRNGNGEICNGTYRFGEYGQYILNISDVKKDTCLPKMAAEPDAAYLPILTTIIVLLSMATLWYIVKGIGKLVIARYFTREDNELGSDTRMLTAEVSLPRTPLRPRLRSLDIFRGLCLALMIFVNAGGGGYAVFAHSTWNGLTVADVVFPWLAFAMGQACVLSLNARLRTAMPRTTAFYQVARRSLVLIMIGIILGSHEVSWSTVRLPGVLQRLGVMYLLVAGLECALLATAQTVTPAGWRGRSLFRDIAAGWRQWLVTLCVVGIQIFVSQYVPAPGCPRGYAGPGGLHLSEGGDRTLQNCTGGIASYIDRTILGESHMYNHGTFKRVYHTTVPHDPEGILGALSGMLVVQAGAHASRVMLVYNHARARIMRWVFWSLVFGLLGGGLSIFSTGGPIAINKNLWSVSYCLVTSSMAMFIQAVLYFVVDLKKKWGGRPLYYAGQNALVIYVGSELLRRHFPFYWRVFAPTHTELLSTHAAATLLWLAVGIALYKKRVFITI